MTTQTKFFSMLGLAMRAGKMIIGEELVLKVIRSKQAKLVILANDASANTTKKIMDKCHFYQITVIRPADRYVLGASIGKEARVTLAIVDEGFAKKMMELVT